MRKAGRRERLTQAQVLKFFDKHLESPRGWPSRRGPRAGAASTTARYTQLTQETAQHTAEVMNTLVNGLHVDLERLS